MAKRTKMNDAARVQPDSVETWAAWLDDNHSTAAGVWLVMWKKTTGRQVVTYETAVVEALRYGWVDSLGRALDDERTMLWFSPRKPGSGWSRPNKERIAQLEAADRMHPSGAAVLAAARADGSWTLLDDVEALVVPADLEAAFAAHPGSREQWDDFPRSARRAILAWIVTAKRPETRQRRIDDTAERAARGERANNQ
jgi:uncharacterized protein YdeI (YjbR/CyaY-like superfamily)